MISQSISLEKIQESHSRFKSIGFSEIGCKKMLLYARIYQEGMGVERRETKI